MINPAGWYAQSDGQQRYWDGQKWTGHRAQGISVVRRRTGARRKWLRHHKIIVAAGVFLMLSVSFGVADSFAEPEVKIAVPATSPGASAADGQPDKEKPEKEGEPREQDFLAVLVGARNRYQATSNEFKKELVSRERDKDLCALWKGSNLAVHDWTGRITRLSAVGGGQGILEVDIGNGMTVRLGNDDPPFDTTYLPVRSDAYAKLAEKETDGEVVFSGRFIEDRGTCLRERSSWESQRLESPHFSFQFFGVK